MATALVGLAVCLVLGYGWLREHDARLSATRDAKRSQDSIVTVARETARAQRAAHTADSLRAAAVIRQRDAALAGERARGARTRDSLTALLDALPLVLSDTLGSWAARVQAQWAAHLEADQRERQAADDALAARDTAYAALERRYAADLGAVRVQLAEAVRLADAANRRASPGLLARVWRTAPWVAGAFVVGRLVM
jgi:hypothetical protein